MSDAVSSQTPGWKGARQAQTKGAEGWMRFVRHGCVGVPFCCRELADANLLMALQTTMPMRRRSLPTAMPLQSVQW